MRRSFRYAVPAALVIGVFAAWTYVTAPSEADILTQSTAVPTTASSTPKVETQQEYIEILESCGPYFEGTCVNVRSGPGSNFPAVTRLRNGVVLAVATTTTVDGQDWHKITFNEWIRYPERVSNEWYVAHEYARAFRDAGNQEVPTDFAVLVQEAGKTLGIFPEKKILVDRSEQKLYAYEGDTLFMETAISTGLDLTPTPRGTFTVFRKTPSRYMQGPLPGISDQYYDLPGVPWNLYFTEQGGAIHGAYWHAEFGKQYSHGCVNLPIDLARTLYAWAPLGTKVIVQD